MYRPIVNTAKHRRGDHLNEEMQTGR